MNIAVIGAGFGGMSAAAYLAKAGHKVVVFEKNDQPGGRARVEKEAGFTFDCGPSWYLMPDVFEEFFADFGHKPSDFYELEKLVPSYRVYDHEGFVDIRSGEAGFKDIDGLDAGAGPRLATHLDQLAKEYALARQKVLNKPGLSIKEFLAPDIVKFLAHPMLMSSLRDRARRVSLDPMIEKILTFMSVFLGAAPGSTPGLYGMLNWVDIGLGVWYPKGGFGAVARAFEKVAEEQGVKFAYNAEIKSIRYHRDKLEIKLKKGVMRFDKVVANADMHHVETQLLEPEDRTITAEKWARKTMSSSGIIGLIGVKRKLDLRHHTLFFDAPWEEHLANVYHHQKLSAEPLFYVCAPSVTDSSVAPKGCENLFILIPTPAGVSLSPEQTDVYIDAAIARIEKATGQQITQHIAIKKSRGPRYFEETFHAYRGNAFGLAHTARQTGPFRPKVQSRKIPDLYYVGQYTNPGTGVPLVVLSGKMVAGVVERDRHIRAAVSKR